MTGKIDRNPDWDFNKLLDWWVDNDYGDANPTTIYAYHIDDCFDGHLDDEDVVEKKECVSFDQVVGFVIEHNTPGKKRDIRYDHITFTTHRID